MSRLSEGAAERKGLLLWTFDFTAYCRATMPLFLWPVKLILSRDSSWRQRKFLPWLIEILRRFRREKLFELRLVEDLDAEGFGLIEFGAWIGADNHIAGFLAHR